MIRSIVGSSYTGITSNLIGRMWQHCKEALKGFTQRYHVHLLVQFETFSNMECAIAREKQLKRWSRQ